MRKVTYLLHVLSPSRALLHFGRRSPSIHLCPLPGDRLTPRHFHALDHDA